MKVCHITSVHKYNDIRISVKECKSLFDAGFDVHIIAPNTNTSNFKGIKVHGLKNNYKSRLNRIRKSSKDIFLKAIEINADVYHFHDPELIYVGLKLLKKGKKVIYDIHEDVPRQIMTKHWIPSYLRSIVSYLFERYENRAAKKFTAIVTATPFIKDRFYSINKNTIDIKNYPILSELYIPDVDYMKKENVIAYIGGISEKRGLFTMVQALDYEKHTTLKLAGNIPNIDEENIVRSMKEWAKVEYFGYIDREGIKNILNKSRAGLVVLHPEKSYIDALPIKMFEYMAAGIPVIASDFPLWNEIIIQNSCGICVDPLDVTAVANAIQWVIDNPEEAKLMGENGRKSIEEKYNWENESKRLIELYNRI